MSAWRSPTGRTGINNAIRGLAAIVKRAIGSQGSAIASSATTAIGAPGTALYTKITGTAAITGFGTVAAGTLRVLEFEGALTLSHNATSLILPGGRNIATAAGDVGLFVSEGGGNWRCLNYQRAAAPAFAAHKNGADQTGMTSSAAVKVTFGTEEFDDGSNFAASTFVAPTPGRYRLTAQLHWTTASAVDGENLQAQIFKNGALHRSTQALRAGTGAVAVSISILVDAAGNDTFEVYGIKGGAGNGTVDGQPARSFFMGELVAP